MFKGMIQAAIDEDQLGGQEKEKETSTSRSMFQVSPVRASHTGQQVHIGNNESRKQQYQHNHIYTSTLQHQGHHHHKTLSYSMYQSECAEKQHVF